MIDESDRQDPKNTEKHRDVLAETIMNDMTYKEVRQKVKDQLKGSYKASTQHFLKEYWKYFEETYGHCPLRVNSD